MRCHSRLAFISLSSLVLPVALHAGESVSRPGVLHLSLDDAIRMALAKNFTIEVARFEPKIARENVTQSLGAFDPTLSAEFRLSEDTTRDVFRREFDTRSDLVLNARHIARTDIAQSGSLSAGLGGITPLGTRYEISLATELNTGVGLLGAEPRQTFDNRGPSFEENFNSTLFGKLTQPLLQGGGTAATLRQVRLARNNQLASEWLLRSSAIEVVADTVNTFNSLHLAQQNLEVALSSRALAQQTLNDNIKRAEIGVMSPLNITTARAEVAAREDDVIRRRREIKDNENFLKQLVTNDLEPMLSVQVEIEPPPSPGFRADVEGGLRDALEIRPDYRQAILDLQRQRINVAFAKNQALPKLDLEASLSLAGLDDDAGTSVDRAVRRDGSAWSIGAIFSVPIPNREGRGAANAAKLSAAQALVSLQKLEQQIVVEVDNASGRVITARERIVANAEATKLARESLDAGEQRLQAGTGTTFEVLELQKRFIEAQFAELSARAEYNKAVNDYYRVTGVTLRVYRVAVGTE